MVKNTTGGKHKNEARKLSSGRQSSVIRLSENELECYAIVTKMYGNGMCAVNAIYQGKTIELMCIIRGKFKSRNKKNNFLMVSSIVLVGFRDWESKQDKCDLLESYDPEQMHILNTIPSIILPTINGNKSNSLSTDEHTDNILFSNDEQFDEVSRSNTHSLSTDIFVNTTGDNVSFDDI